MQNPENRKTTRTTTLNVVTCLRYNTEAKTVDEVTGKVYGPYSNTELESIIKKAFNCVSTGENAVMEIIKKQFKVDAESKFKFVSIISVKRYEAHYEMSETAYCTLATCTERKRIEENEVIENA